MTIREDEINLEAIKGEALAFHQGFKSVQLATSREDLPVASYAPFVRDSQGTFFVYLSDLAQHTGNLVINPRASLLFIENEADAAHLFGRRRVTYQCDVEAIERGTPVFEAMLDEFERVHGSFMQMLRGLLDFRLFALHPAGANYVKGFAQAYELHGAGLAEIRHVNDRGHRDSRAARQEAGGVSESS